MMIVLFSVGSNLKAGKNIASALTEISKISAVKKVSSLYSTTPVGYMNQPEFLNLAVEAEIAGEYSAVSALALLSAVKEIEKAIGRKKRLINGPREIDIDILDIGGQILKTGKLQLPHPRMIFRKFVIIPLLEIFPGYIHPLTGQPIRKILDNLQNFSDRVRKKGQVLF